MAGEQDILSLGLNIDSFTAEKKKTLKEYVALFDKLSKYDGKIFNPVMGDGLQTFNTSIAQTSKLLDEVNAKLSKLGTTKVTRNSFPTEEVKNFTNEINRSSSSIENMGRGLTKTFGYLRNIAYILPGLGIAGIFNLAFNAIESAANAIFDFGNNYTDLIDKQDRFNKGLKEQIDNMKVINDLADRFNRIYGSGYESGDLEKQVQLQKDILNTLNAQGISKDVILAEEVKLAKVLKDRAATDVQGKGGIPFVEGDIQTRRRNLAIIKNDIVDINNALANGVGWVDKENKEFITSQKTLEKKRDSLQGSFQVESAILSDLEKNYTDYYETINDYERKKAELIKFNSDQARKLLVESSKDDISVTTQKNKIILSDIRTTHEETLKTLKEELNAQKKLNDINRISVTGTSSNPNVSATPAEIKIAKNKQRDEDLKAQQKYNEEVLRENISFYQKILKAEIEIQKNEVELDAINNEKIQQNEQASLSERLAAYSKYISGKTRLEQLEFELASSAGKQSANDPKSSLTQKEIDKLASDRDKQILVAKSDAEQKIYGIVYSSLQKQLKLIVDEGDAEGEYNDQLLIDDLNRNNKLYKDKKESLIKYLKERKRILEQDERLSLQKDIDDSKKQGLILFNRQQDLLKQQEDAQKKLNDLKNLPEGTPDKKFQVDKAQGELNAITTALEDTNKQVSIVKKRQKTDELKQAKIAYEDDNKLRREWVDAALEIEKALYEGVKSVSDRIYENKLTLLDRQKELLDEQYDAERDAVEKSSLNLKDKQALEIQLAEQKREADIQASLEERRLRREEAEFNKKLQIANASIGIAAAIIKDGLTTPKSIADAIAGTIQLATIITTEIPSFAKGTDYLPKGTIARFGEDGAEEIRIPGKKPFVALSETISYLPQGTKIIPLTHDHPEFGINNSDDSWEQTRFLANQIKRSKQEIKNVFRPTIIVDMGFESYKRSIFGN